MDLIASKSTIVQIKYFCRIYHKYVVSLVNLLCGQFCLS
jgi:hypothetical protein